MKPLLSLLCLLAAGAFAAQHGGGAVSGHPGGAHRGAGHRYGSAYGGGRYGLNGYGGYGYGGYGLGYWGDYGYDPGFYPFTPPAEPPMGPPPMMAYPQAEQPMPQPPVHPVIHEYNPPADSGPAPDFGAEPAHYLIAFRDKSVHPAMTYWVQAGTLHYLDLDHTEQQAALASVDRNLSAQLNREHHLPFSLQ